MSITCPVCNKDDVIQKVAAIIVSGRASGTFSGPSGGVTYSDGKWGTVGGYSVLSGQTTTELAQLLAIPKKPKEHAFSCLATGVILYFFGFGGLVLITIYLSFNH